MSCILNHYFKSYGKKENSITNSYPSKQVSSREINENVIVKTNCYKNRRIAKNDSCGFINGI